MCKGPEAGRTSGCVCGNAGLSGRPKPRERERRWVVTAGPEPTGPSWPHGDVWSSSEGNRGCFVWGDATRLSHTRDSGHSPGLRAARPHRVREHFARFSCSVQSRRRGPGCVSRREASDAGSERAGLCGRGCSGLSEGRAGTGPGRVALGAGRGGHAAQVLGAPRAGPAGKAQEQTSFAESQVPTELLRQAEWCLPNPRPPGSPGCDLS